MLLFSLFAHVDTTPASHPGHLIGKTLARMASTSLWAVSYGNDVGPYGNRGAGERDATRKVGAKPGRRRGWVLLEGRGGLAHRGLLRRRLRLCGNAPGGFPGRPRHLRRTACDHAGVLRLRHLLLAAGRGVV